MQLNVSSSERPAFAHLAYFEAPKASSTGLREKRRRPVNSNGRRNTKLIMSELSIQFVRPWRRNLPQNACIERFDRAFRTAALDRYVFTSQHEVRRMVEDWRHRYNQQRPYRALGGPSPIAYAKASSSTSTCG